jgi:hypothetical protein
MNSKVFEFPAHRENSRCDQGAEVLSRLSKLRRRGWFRSLDQPESTGQNTEELSMAHGTPKLFRGAPGRAEQNTASTGTKSLSKAVVSPRGWKLQDS